MKLKDCTFGKLVCTKDDFNKVDRVGMVIGVTNNITHLDVYKQLDPTRTIPLVKWANGLEHGIHHNNLEIFKEV